MIWKDSDIGDDIMIILKKILTQIHQVIDDLHLDGEVDKVNLLKQMISLESSMNLVYTQMKDIRLLFPAAKAKAKGISVLETLEKVNRLYMGPFQKSQIEVSQTVLCGDMVIKATEAVSVCTAMGKCYLEYVERR